MPLAGKLQPTTWDIVGSPAPQWGKINPKWPTAAILEIHKQVYLSHFWTDFHQISCADQQSPYELHLGHISIKFST